MQGNGGIFRHSSELPQERPGLSKLKPYLPAVLWAALVLSIGSLHHVPAPETGLPIDKVGHFVMYGILGLLAATGWARNGRRSPMAVPLLLAMSVGAVDEIHQRYVSGRSSDIMDFAADAAGITVAFTLVARRNRAPGETA